MIEFDNIMDPDDPASSTPTPPGGLRDSLSSFADAYSQHANPVAGEDNEDQEAEDGPTPAEHFGATLGTVAGGMGRVNDMTRWASPVVHGYSGRVGDPTGGAAAAALMNAGTRPRGTATSWGTDSNGVDQISPGTTPLRTSVDF